MKSFQDPDQTFAGMPAGLGVVLSRVDRASGYERKLEEESPRLLLRLAQRTKVESIWASNAIEGVEVDPSRAQVLAEPDPPRFRNRSEKEFAGYADALDGLTSAEQLEPLTVPRLLEFHRKMLAHTDARGGYLKREDNVIADRDADGKRRIIFKPPPHTETEGLLGSLCASYEYALEHETAHPLVLLSAFILDLLAIHPVIDGNGRMSRLATTHELLRLNYGVARYVSVEQKVLESKNAYYTALERSQRNWHTGGHDIWPWTEYLVRILAEAYDELERRVETSRGKQGGLKQDEVRHWVLHEAPPVFRFSEAKRALPGISPQTIRLTLQALRKEGLLETTGAGRGARWRRVGSPATPYADQSVQTPRSLTSGSRRRSR